MLVSFSVSLAKSGVHVFVLTRFPSSRFKTFLLLFVFAFLISNDSLIFRLWYCCSVDKVLGFIQLNCPWHSRQCSVAPELSHFPLKLSCWCSMVLVMTFFLVSPIYRALRVQSNWWTPGKLLRSSFDLFHSHKKQIVWKLGLNGPFYALMLRTNLY